MKTQEEIEKLAKQDFNDRQECGHYELADLKSIDYYYDGFTNGYTQCQKDMIKSDMIKSVCPKCKAIMPCECNPPKQISLLDSVRANPSWATIIREFHLATQQVPKGAPPLIIECWLVENYNPPTKKQD